MVIYCGIINILQVKTSNDVILEPSLQKLRCGFNYFLSLKINKSVITMQ